MAAGGVTITATDVASGLSGTALLAVTPVETPPPPVTLVSIAVAPATTSITVGQTAQFGATGTYSDLSTQNLTQSVTWSSSNPSVATISNAAGTKGRATGVAAGGTTITATGAGGTAGTAVLPVTPPVVIPPVVIPPVVPPSTTQVALVPGAGKPGSNVNIVGTKFQPFTNVKVTYRTGVHPRQVKLCKVAVAANGTFRCLAQIPLIPKAGAVGPHVVATKTVGRKGSILTNFQLLP